MKSLPCHLFTLLATAGVSQAAITIAGSSLDWIPFTGNYDYLDDQQTGQPSADIVGSGTNYGFYVAFNDNGASLSTDGDLAFRVRFDAAGDNKNPANFKNVVWIGIDADISGTIDVFLGLSDSGSSTDLVIRDAGTGLNNSPSTTSISNTNYWTAPATSSNYSYRAVNSGAGPTGDGGTTNDIRALGTPDYYVSFMVPFQQIVSFLGTQSINITDQSALRYAPATSTQTNSLNQDLGGINDKTAVLTNTWEQLGGFTQTVNASGTVVPEPSSATLAIGAMLACLSIRRRH